MFCPNCGHKVEPGQKFCDNCGWALKNNTQAQENDVKEDDSIRSLSEIEEELDKDENKDVKTAPNEPKQVLQQAPAQKREFDAQRIPEEKPKQPTFQGPERVYEKHNGSSFEKSGSFNDDATQKFDRPDLDDLEQPTQAYDKSEFKQAVNNPYIADKEPEPKDYRNNYQDPYNKPKEDQKANKATDDKSNSDQNDGFVHNMLQFAKNNGYLSIFAVVIAAILLVVKRNYGWIALVALILIWFLAAQLNHGKEVGLNQKFKRNKKEEPKKDVKKDNYDPNDPMGYNSPHPYDPKNYQEPTHQKTTHHAHKPKSAKDRVVTRGKNNRQKLIIASSLINFVALLGGPFINGVSVSGTIATATNYSYSSLGSQATLIMNISSAVRVICFLSPIICLIAACFRSRGSIRTVRLFTVLQTIIYVLVYGIFSSGLISAAALTGQSSVNGSAAFGYSFYILLATSAISLILSYTLQPKERI